MESYSQAAILLLQQDIAWTVELVYHISHYHLQNTPPSKCIRVVVMFEPQLVPYVDFILPKYHLLDSNHHFDIYVQYCNSIETNV